MPESKESKGTSGEDIGRPGPWGEGRYQRADEPVNESVRIPPGTSPATKKVVSTPVTRRDYEPPGQEGNGEKEPPGGDAG
jgi:hypothetical protein